jgi:hypothetical protein
VHTTVCRSGRPARRRVKRSPAATAMTSTRTGAGRRQIQSQMQTISIPTLKVHTAEHRALDRWCRGFSSPFNTYTSKARPPAGASQHCRSMDCMLHMPQLLTHSPVSVQAWCRRRWAGRQGA